MNIIEASNFYLRVTGFDFKNRDEGIKLKFRIIPMIHIGTKEYYEEVYSYLKDCDEIIYEGIKADKIRSTASRYKAVAEQLNLVTQSEYLNISNLPAKLIHADFTMESESTEWHRLKLCEKLKLSIILPFYLWYESMTLNRKQLVKQCKSLQYIIFAEQDSCLVTVYTRMGKSYRWKSTDYDGLEQSFEVNGQTVSLEDLYENIVFKSS